MSAVQSHIQPGVPQPQYALDNQQRQVNAQRQPSISQSPALMNLYGSNQPNMTVPGPPNPSFARSQPQIQHHQQQQLHQQQQQQHQQQQQQQQLQQQQQAQQQHQRRQEIFQQQQQNQILHQQMLAAAGQAALNNMAQGTLPNYNNASLRRVPSQPQQNQMIAMHATPGAGGMNPQPAMAMRQPGPPMGARIASQIPPAGQIPPDLGSGPLPFPRPQMTSVGQRVPSAQGQMLGALIQNHGAHPGASGGSPHQNPMPQATMGRTPFQPSASLPHPHIPQGHIPTGHASSPARHSPHSVPHPQMNPPVGTTPGVPPARVPHQPTPEMMFTSIPNSIPSYTASTVPSGHSMQRPPPGTQNPGFAFLPQQTAKPAQHNEMGASQPRPNFVPTPAQHLNQELLPTLIQPLTDSSPRNTAMSPTDAQPQPGLSRTPRPQHQQPPMNVPRQGVPQLASQPQQPPLGQVANRPLMGAPGYPPYSLSGQGLLRLSQYSSSLSSESPERSHIGFWKRLVDNQFTPHGTMKLTLWKDNQRVEAKPFEIGVSIIPRFFVITAQAGVTSMSLGFDHPQERMGEAPGTVIVSCLSATWTFRYSNGYSVTLRGYLSALFAIVPQTQTSPTMLKIHTFSFESLICERFLSVESIMGMRGTPKVCSRAPPSPSNPASPIEEPERIGQEKIGSELCIGIEHATIPAEPVNAFGIPQATMRCLELAESVGQMSRLIEYSWQNPLLGPILSLRKYNASAREAEFRVGPGTVFHMGINGTATGPLDPSQGSKANGSVNTPGPHSVPTPASSGRLQPASLPPPLQQQQTSSPQSQGGGGPPPLSGPAAPAGASSNPLKRKAAISDAMSPPADQPSKRPQRRKSRNAG